MESPTPSPCTRECVLAEDRRTCTGCLRTLEEIVAWSRADETFRRAVVARIAARRANDAAPRDGTEPR